MQVFDMFKIKPAAKQKQNKRKLNLYEDDQVDDKSKVEDQTLAPTGPEQNLQNTRFDVEEASRISTDDQYTLQFDAKVNTAEGAVNNKQHSDLDDYEQKPGRKRPLYIQQMMEQAKRRRDERSASVQTSDKIDTVVANKDQDQNKQQQEQQKVLFTPNCLWIKQGGESKSNIGKSLQQLKEEYSKRLVELFNNEVTKESSDDYVNTEYSKQGNNYYRWWECQLSDEQLQEAIERAKQRQVSH
ncbi:hypothetical protein MIR68_006213 [Amoeboaphelidium protococcarum]|nr:hypothetical protein MIR68_006213 [Amoeboaphelidium protococcarum]